MRQLIFAVVGLFEGGSVGPFAPSGLNEALSFPWFAGA